MARYLGIDYGAKRVGAALSDEEGKIAFPHGEFQNDAGLMSKLSQLIADRKVTAIVVGDTRASSGLPNRVTSEAEDFIATLAKVSGIAVTRASEVWSSIEASRYAPKGHEHDNAAAAAVILQRFLDMKGTNVE